MVILLVLVILCIMYFSKDKVLKNMGRLWIKCIHDRWKLTRQGYSICSKTSVLLKDMPFMVSTGQASYKARGELRV